MEAFIFQPPSEIPDKPRGKENYTNKSLNKTTAELHTMYLEYKHSMGTPAEFTHHPLDRSVHTHTLSYQTTSGAIKGLRT